MGGPYFYEEKYEKCGGFVRWYLLKFLLEVVVHPCVQERVVDIRAHGDHVRDEKREKKIAPPHHGTAVFLRHQQQIQRQPADHEYRHHGNEHPIRASFATNFKLHLFSGNIHTYIIHYTYLAISTRHRCC